MIRDINITGMKFGRLTPIKMVGVNKYNQSMWKCVCDCGKIKITNIYRLTCGDTKSCGCIKKEMTGNLKRKHGFASIGKDRFYKIFMGIKVRCNNSRHQSFKYYGARGIKCLWKSFEEFRDDMYPLYLKHTKEFGEKNTSIERKDNNGNYCRENCCWATVKEQSQNKRTNRIIIHNGISKNVSEWADIIGLNQSTISNRINRSGWNLERALTTPVKN